MENEQEKVLDNIEEKKISKNAIKNTKQIMAVIAVIVGIVVIAVIAGVCIYNTRGNRLARAFDLGQKYLLEEDYEQAIVEFDKVIEIEPMNVDAYLGKAEACVGLDDMEMAIAVLEQGYELTASEVIRQRLDELRGSMAEAESVEIEDSTAGEDNMLEGDELGEGELPYYELGFSSEDFTLAGYSVMDGDHIDDIEKAAAAIMPNVDNIWENTGWYYGRQEWEAAEVVILDYYMSERHGWEVIHYEKYDDGTLTISVNDCNGEFSINEYPLFEGKVLPGMSYEETFDILGIKQIVQIIEENKKDGEDAFFEFESQYGYMSCSGAYPEISIYFAEEGWYLFLVFHDNALTDVATMGIWR